MKKNLMTVLILALLVVNLVFTAIIMISLVPSAKQSNTLTEKICTALDLELASGRTANLSSVAIEDLDTYEMADSMTINLKTGEDGGSHYAVITVSLSMDMTNSDYSTIGANILEGTYDSNIKNIVNDIISRYTYEEFKDADGAKAAQKEILEKLQGLFDSSMIVDVGFPTKTLD